MSEAHIQAITLPMVETAKTKPRGRPPKLAPPDTPGGRLQAARIDRGLTQDQLADELGCDRSMISKYESGEHNMEAAFAKRAAEFFGVRAGVLLFGDDGADIQIGLASEEPEGVELAQRVRRRLDALRTNAFEAARLGGLERNFINDILIGKKTSVQGRNLVKLAKALEVTPDYFLLENHSLKGDGDVTGGDNTAVAVADVLQDLRFDTIAIPEVDVHLSAGGGYVVDRENIKDIWQFSRRYIIDELRLTPSNLDVVKVDGDSMFPTLWPGDRVIVDRSDRNPAKPGIYALWDDNATVVKRVEKIPASDPPRLVLISDNKNHNPYEVRAELVNVIGRVVWFARRL